MDSIMDFLDMVKDQPSGFYVERNGEKVNLSQNELEEAVFYYYDQLGQGALNEASAKTGKAFTDEQKEKLLEEITMNLSVMVHEKILDIANKVYSK